MRQENCCWGEEGNKKKTSSTCDRGRQRGSYRDHGRGGRGSKPISYVIVRGGVRKTVPVTVTGKEEERGRSEAGRRPRPTDLLPFSDVPGGHLCRSNGKEERRRECVTMDGIGSLSATRGRFQIRLRLLQRCLAAMVMAVGFRGVLVSWFPGFLVSRSPRRSRLLILARSIEGCGSTGEAKRNKRTGDRQTDRQKDTGRQRI